MFSVLLFIVEWCLSENCVEHDFHPSSLLYFPQCVMFLLVSSNRKVINICPCNT